MGGGKKGRNIGRNIGRKLRRKELRKGIYGEMSSGINLGKTEFLRLTVEGCDRE